MDWGREREGGRLGGRATRNREKERFERRGKGERKRREREEEAGKVEADKFMKTLPSGLIYEILDFSHLAIIPT